MRIRKTFMIRLLVFLLLLTLLPVSVFCESACRTLKTGDQGADVLALKDRLRELGYITAKKYGDDYNRSTAQKIKDLQKKNGLKATGIATAELQELIFSDLCVTRSGLRAEDLMPSASWAVTVPDHFDMPAPAGEHPPELNAEGYYDADEPYFFASRETGEWTYVSRDIRVEIRQHTDKTAPHIWLVAAVRYREPAFFGSMLSEASPDKPRKSGLEPAKPLTIAEKHHAVLPSATIFSATGCGMTSGRVSWCGTERSGRKRPSPRTPGSGHRWISSRSLRTGA